MFAGVSLLAIVGNSGLATADDGGDNSQTTTQNCPIDTSTDQSTGRQKTEGTGVKVCGDGHSGSVEVDTTGKELEHFAKYPIGQSDKSVAKQVGNTVHKAVGDASGAVHNFFHHL
ncbi:MAG: hypothetical protein WB764_10280 [Xanthobacteraceae bacterium]